MPSLSVVIPVLNEAEVLGDLLAQLRRLPGRCELIVVDGGSGDGTVACAEALADHTLVSPVAGRAAQMNLGAARARGDILWFLHADSELIALPANYWCALGEPVCWGYFPLRLSGRRIEFRVLERAINWRSRLTAVATGDQGIFVRRECFEALQGYADLPLMEDVELSKRLRRLARPRVATQALQTASRRWERYGLWRTVVLMWRLRLLYFLGVSPERLAADYSRQEE